MAGSSEHGNETVRFVTCGEFIGYPRNYQLLKTESAHWSFVVHLGP